MSANPGDAVEAFGWGPTVSIILSAVAAALSIGGARQMLASLDKKVAELKAETHADIREAKEAGEKAGRELGQYIREAREKFAIAEDLRTLERNLGSKIETTHAETRRQVEELRTEIGRKNITHTINNAITTGMAQAIKELRNREDRS